MRKDIRREQTPKQAEKSGYVAYYRVSTDRQGESGLGLEAQQEAARRVARHTPILAEFTEVETAKKSHAGNRPQLIAAIEEAKRRGCICGFSSGLSFDDNHQSSAVGSELEKNELCVFRSGFLERFGKAHIGFWFAV